MTKYPPRWRRIKGGHNWYLDNNPPPTLEQQIEELEATIAELEEATRVPYEILERIGLKLGMAQHPMREIGAAVVELIEHMEIPQPILGRMRAGLEAVGCQGDGSCSNESGWCCVCLALCEYEMVL